MKNKGYAKFVEGVGGGGQIRCIMGNVEVAYFSLSPRGFFFQLLQFSHLIKGRLKFQLDPERTNASHVFALLGFSWVKSTVTITCKTDAFYIVMLDVLCASSRCCLLQSCASNVSSLITIIYVLLDMSAVHETTKSKLITKFTDLRNVILLSRLSAV